MHNQYDPDQQLEAFLAHLGQCTDNRQQGQETKRIIDVYVIDHTHDGIEEENHTQDVPFSTVESTLEGDDGELSQHTMASSTEPISQSPSLRRHPLLRNRFFLLSFVAAIGLLLGTGVFTLISLGLPLSPLSATVTLLPASRTLTTQTTLHVNNRVLPTDSTENWVQGRMLDAVTIHQARTVATTGITSQNARAASGFLTFYNAAPYTQTISAGTVVTGTDGMHVITDQSATISAAVFPTEGQARVLAHAVITGSRGNIEAGDIYGACCRLNVFVTNDVFHGGQDAFTYRSIDAQDVTQAATTLLTTNLTPAIQAAIHAEVRSDETLLTPIACTTPNISSDQPVGADATQVTVTVEEACRGEVYNTYEFQQAVTQNMIRDAQQQMGMSYVLNGAVQSTITHSTFNASEQSGTITVAIISTWVYQMHDSQQQQIKAMLVGKHENEALVQMLHEPGVRGVSISLTHGSILPQNTKDIALVIISPI